MTISSSLNAGVAGLAANASRLASISDNIANSATYGYRRVETDFHSMVLSNSGRAYAAGGVRTTNQRLIDQSGSLVTTSNATDLSVRGRGFLPVARATQVGVGNGDTTMYLSTTGSFRTDADGYLRTESGLTLMGWPALADGSIPTYPRDTSAGLVPVQVNANQFTGEPTTRMSLGVNLPAVATSAGASGEVEELSVEYFDNLGTSENLSVEFSPTVPATGSSNAWTMVIRDSASGDAVVGEYNLIFDDGRSSGGTLASVATVSGGGYDPTTGTMIVDVAGGPMEINIGRPGESGGLTQLSDSFAPLSISKDGSPVGNMTSVEVDENGFVYALFDTGVSRRIYQIPLVDMPNPNGMVALDQQTYLPSPDSGTYFLWDAGDGPTGDVAAYSREESTTDVAGELTTMIKTQRAYSSNAKVIQTVDEMLQETTNIKR
ncbi:flagellar hook-basal body complex protein [Lutimaribacter sp. EGI FJ00015]|uniref:Flagellar hook-basal body complex protein n=1 Tax=Lutimaribacter degradans TaxID=2945989 RepID=A0ACC5ZU98_9RHOB|nr:flagellar hook-basal body complex protein [Lutimaribacter sp. EGI FJ00013]MCM2561919.1 flagellar hook-basal body complex protein [Lutimaribacter sp. EGI FJ00013]MCO0613049.1 flagellar hook-basal body complex protein [Lutimaribacter sp. EGI FJ00015]